MRQAANAITIMRVAFVLIAVTQHVTRAPAASYSWLLILCAFALDGLDGPIARRYKCNSTLGSVVDVIGDRIIEAVLLALFITCGNVPAWLWITLYVRIIATDTLRLVAYRSGYIDDGHVWVLPHLHSLLFSRWSRFSYGAMKAAYFGALSWIASSGGGADVRVPLASAVPYLGVGVVGMSLLRGLPLLLTYRFWITPHACSRSVMQSTRGRTGIEREPLGVWLVACDACCVALVTACCMR